ncbi:MAG: glutathione S-transferase family protein [Alphaproteobacteria bacterium]|nr:glutathione S-transferase family protein [Alphaproteobacteria bacterium]
MIKIYNFPRGRGVRVVWLCEEMGLPYRIEPVSFPPSDEYRRINPLGQVPFLEDEGDVAINESIAMLLYLAEKYGPSPLLPAKNDPKFARVLQMTVFGEATLGASINSLMIDRFMVPEGEKSGTLVKLVEGRVEQQVSYVERILGAGPFLAGSEFTIADISVTYALGIWSGFLQKPLSAAVAAYVQRVTSRPAYERAGKAQ